MFEESMTSKCRVVPAIIPTSQRHLDTTLEQCASFAEEVQVDIVDGKFAGTASWPYEGVCSPELLLEGYRFDGVPVELDLMITNPEETIDLWLKTGARKIVVHIESTKHIDDIIEQSAPKGFHLGISLNNDTDLSVLDNIDMDAVEYIQLMGIKEIGAQGQPFDERVLERIKEVRRLYPRLPISIDGSVNKETIIRLAHAGASRFVAGSAVLKTENWGEAYASLKELVTKAGL